MRFLRSLFPLTLAAASVMSVGQAKVVLGRLGQTLRPTRVYASPSLRSRVYYRMSADAHLVVRHLTSKGWDAVLLQNGNYGYVPAAAVKELPYEITANAAPRGGRAVCSRGAASEVADYAMNFRGTPYRWGGNNLRSGIDCSGFVQELFGQIGISLPRTAAEQSLVGRSITRLEDLRKGDRLYFWDYKRNTIGHTGIYMGDGNFVHSSSTHHGVATDYLGAAKWRRLLVAARR